MPQPTRLDAARHTAITRLDFILDMGRQREAARNFCRSLLGWVFGRQTQRPDESNLSARRLKFARNSVIDAANTGLDHAFGDSRRHEIDPQIFDRLELLRQE